LSGDARGGCVKIEDGSRNGFRDTGRGGGSKGDVVAEGNPEDTTRLRKGLFEERLRGARTSKAQTRGSLVIGFMHVQESSETDNGQIDTPNASISGEGALCFLLKRARPGLMRRLTLFWLDERHCGDAPEPRIIWRMIRAGVIDRPWVSLRQCE
jgi:hypothetical protein